MSVFSWQAYLLAMLLRRRGVAAPSAAHSSSANTSIAVRWRLQTADHDDDADDDADDDDNGDADEGDETTTVASATRPPAERLVTSTFALPSVDPIYALIAMAKVWGKASD